MLLFVYKSRKLIVALYASNCAENDGKKPDGLSQPAVENSSIFSKRFFSSGLDLVNTTLSLVIFSHFFDLLGWRYTKADEKSANGEKR